MPALVSHCRDRLYLFPSAFLSENQSVALRSLQVHCRFRTAQGLFLDDLVPDKQLIGILWICGDAYHELSVFHPFAFWDDPRKFIHAHPLFEFFPLWYFSLIRLIFAFYIPSTVIDKVVLLESWLASRLSARVCWVWTTLLRMLELWFIYLPTFSTIWTCRYLWNSCVLCISSWAEPVTHVHYLSTFVLFCVELCQWELYGHVSTRRSIASLPYFCLLLLPCYTCLNGGLLSGILSKVKRTKQLTKNKFNQLARLSTVNDYLS